MVIDDAIGMVGGGTVELGSITLVGETALQEEGLPVDLAQIGTIVNMCEPCAEAMNTFLSKTNGAITPGEGGFGFDFPVLRDPGTLAGLLLGRDVELFTFDTGRLGPSSTSTSRS